MGDPSEPPAPGVVSVCGYLTEDQQEILLFFLLRYHKPQRVLFKKGLVSLPISLASLTTFPTLGLY